MEYKMAFKNLGENPIFFVRQKIVTNFNFQKQKKYLTN